MSICHRFDVGFGNFKVPAVDSTAASNAKLQQQADDATDATFVEIEITAVRVPMFV